MIFPFRDNVPAERTPFVTYFIIAANVLALVWLTRLPPLEQNAAAFQHGFIPARLTGLKNHQPLNLRVPVPPRPGLPRQVMVVNLPANRGQIYLSLLTAMFLHGGWIHLIGNMWFLWIFGDNVEDRLGHLAYAVLYVVGGTLATFCHWFMQPTSTLPVIGASGAVAAVLGAYLVTWPFARIHSFVFLVIFFTVLELPALVVLGLWFLEQLVAARAVENRLATAGVAWWAHVGGFLAGMALMQVLNVGPRQPESHEEYPFGARDEDQRVV